MKKSILILFLLLSSACYVQVNHFTTADYSKMEVTIPMRDGVKLFTAIYTPKDTTQVYPVLIKRTPYSVAPYGEQMPGNIMHNPNLVAAGYIFVHQDMRGRWMSEGEFENTKPPYSWKDESKTDEVTDSYDTFDWLAKNLKHFNGNMGQYGNSYLGHTSLVAAVTGHPNMKAVLAMAPVTNFYFEDFNRYGLYGTNYMPVMDVFGIQKTGTTKEAWYNVVNKNFTLNAENGLMADYYDYFLKRRALSQTTDVISPDNFFWKNIIAHPNYDAYRQERNWLQYLHKSKCQTLVVGGWNDEQNLYGILNSFKTMYAEAPDSKVQLVIGPWSHGHPQRRDSLYYLGDIFYGYDLAKDYQENIEYKYFEFHLKGLGEAPQFRAHVFDTGKKEWKNFSNNPFEKVQKTQTLYLNPNGSLTEQASNGAQAFLADPAHPVPYIANDDFHIMAPKHYMTDDQRFVSKRPDVLTYVTEELTTDLQVQGEIKALIQFMTDHQDADLFVKVIDVFPSGRLPEVTDVEGVKMNGFQHLVRVGYIRGRYRNSFVQPEAFQVNKKALVDVPLLEVYHTFKKGHRLMIQVQSSMFPLFDLNPQRYIDNIYEAKDSDFEQAKHQVFGESKIILPIVGE